ASSKSWAQLAWLVHRTPRHYLRTGNCHRTVLEVRPAHAASSKSWAQLAWLVHRTPRHYLRTGNCHRTVLEV
ncbi:hypothetical protein VS873_24055, partial [Salmonella enterica subsp. enterica serovar Typhi]|nr:hypothetical protein [Salmonella enterica subsp. enterica serovar Typhi]